MKIKESYFVSSLKVLLLMLLLAGTQISFAAEPLIVPNSGFETGLESWTLADENGSQHRATLVETTKHSGQNALSVEKINVRGAVRLQSALITIQEKKAYDARVWLNTLPADQMRKTPSTANIYFAIKQYGAGKELPGINGPIRPFFSSDRKWQQLKMSFVTSPNAEQIRLELVISDDTAELLIDDISLEEYKPYYDPATPEKLMPQAEAEKILQTRKRATAEVRHVGERPRLFIDGKESFPAFYVSNAWQGMKAQVGDFQKAGVRVFLIPYTLGRGVYGDFGAWSGAGKVDFSEVDEMLWRVLRADPQAYIMFYLVTDPYPNWPAEHPDAILTNEKGEKAIIKMHFERWDTKPPKETTDGRYDERYGYSYVSQELRQETGKVLRQFDQHIKNSLPGKAVIGYHVNGGYDGQMIQWDDFVDGYSDYSLASLRAFREWLAEKYFSDAALQKAWHRSEVTLQTAAIPDATRRATTRLFLDQPEDQDIIDFNRFRSEGIVDTLDGYAKVLRESHETPIILGTYYSGPGRRAPSNYATGYLLRKKQFNYVTSTMGYGNIRWPGNPGKSNQVWSSLLLHDMFGLVEQDFRSWKRSPSSNPKKNFQVARVETAEESNAMVRRDAGFVLAQGQGNWWFDMGGGWFNDPSIMRAIEEAVRGYQLDLNDNARPRADVAVFIDEKSMDYLASEDKVGLQFTMIKRQTEALNSSGVPYHLYLQEDIANKDLPEYKLYVFLNPYRLTEAEWSALQKLRRDGKTFAFMHAPGIVSSDVIGSQSASETVAKITGIKVADPVKRRTELQTVPDNGIFSEASPSWSTLSLPAFAVTDNAALPIAKYADGQTGVAYKDLGTWKSLFFGSVGINEFFFNALAKQAGAWVAAPTGNIVYASQHFVTVHAMYPGTKTVQLLEPSKVTDLVDGKVLSPKTQTLTLPMQRGETRWFYLEPQKAP